MKRLVIDTSGLLLLAVGRADLRYLSFKRVQEYGQEGFHRFAELIRIYDKIVATPHSLTETWNLLGNDKSKDERARAIKIQIQFLTNEILEIYEPSHKLSSYDDFLRFGFSDIAQLHAAESYSCPILTSDEHLHHAALSRGIISFHLAEMKMQ